MNHSLYQQLLRVIEGSLALLHAQLNYRFFRSFLKSFNQQLFEIIKKKNILLSKNPENKLLDFNSILEHICRMLYTLIDKIFLKKNPDDASDNFIDPRGRYMGKNIALRVLELFMFQEINFSDDIWTEYLVSQNRNHIQKLLNVDIPEEYFYSDKELIKLLTIYNFQSFSNALNLENG